MEKGTVIAVGGIEKIGASDSFLKTKLPQTGKFFSKIPNHEVGMEVVLNMLTDKKNGIISSLKEIDAVGNRVTHGGPFSKSTLITPERMAQWEKYTDLAPVHNPSQFKNIRAVNKYLPGVPQVAIFDTAFHQTIPDYAYLYALPYKYYTDDNIRRYGFHGTSFRYVLERSAEYLHFNPKEKRIIICHIGNGVSVCAIKNGKSIDTSLGMMPNEGPMMGTRTGDIDSSVVLFLMKKHNLTPDQTMDILNKESGLLGVSGITNDMRELIQAAHENNQRAQLAFNIYTYRIKKYIGAFTAALGGVDYIIFTAGVGENQPPVRKACLEGLEFLGIKLDIEKNEKLYGYEDIISTPDSKVTVAVIPTDEELMMARDTIEIVKELN